MSQALYRKWRPQRWDEVVGQEHVVQTLRNAVVGERVAHAYLLAGPRGTGKTTTARLLAKAVNCIEPDLAKRPCDACENCKSVNQGRFLDLIEIDAASNTSVEDVRSLRDKINFSPNQGRYKVYIIDEVHMLSTAAFNALLKTLEEPPSHAIFILATTEVHKIPATVMSRCQRHEFRRIPVNDIVVQLKKLAEGEGLEVDNEVLSLVARQATGSLRDAISLLDQLASSGAGVTLDQAHSVLGTAASQSVLDLVSALVAAEPAQGLEHIHTALDSGSDPRQYARQIVDYLRNLLLVRMGNANQIDAPADVRSQMARHAQELPVPALLRVIRIFNHAAAEARISWQPALPLEMAFVEAIQNPAEAPAASAEVSAPAAQAARPAQRASQTAAPLPKPPQAAGAAPTVQAESHPVKAEGGEGLTMEKLMQSWRKVLALARERNPQTQGLLNSCKPLGFKDRSLYLAFNSDLTRAKMERPDHLKIAEEVLKQVFGVEVPVTCVVTSGRRSTPPAGVDADGMVATALRDLGGEISDTQ